MNIQFALFEANKILLENNIKSSRLDSEILLSKVLEKDRKFIILNLHRPLDSTHYRKFKNLISQRSRRKPIAYLIGKKDFWKYEFYISDAVLIPRPETEIIIEETLRIFRHKTKLNVLEIGIGSGCILLSILKEKKNCKGVGIDISKKSVELSKINALKLDINDRVKFLKSDVDNFFYGKYDLIVSNPPYIKKHDLKYLELDVAKYEPRLALDGGIDGVSEIIKVVDKSSKLVKKGGKLILEINFDQVSKVKKILNKKGFYINKVLKDLGKNDRCIVSTKL
jgi:release factor glutamine methyltransferase